MEQEKEQFKGKVVVVTGASKGIGSGICKSFADCGATVLGLSRSVSNTDVLMESDDSKDRIIRMVCDVTNPDQVHETIRNIADKYGKIDILVNNAGINLDSGLLKMSSEKFQQVLDVNIVGVFNMTQAVGSFMKTQGSGAIINISSIASRRSNYGQSNYAASKGAIESFTRASSIELVKYGIRVNAVAPGCVMTQMFDKVSNEIIDDLKNRIPIKRFAETQDIANVVKFLAGDASRYIVGETITVDGGMSISIM